MASAEIGIAIVLRGLGTFRQNMGAAQSDINRFERSIAGMAGSAGKFGQTLTSLGTAIMGMGRTLTLGITAPLVAVNTALVNAGIQFEDAFAGVSKTVDGIADDFGNLTELGLGVRQEFRDMALEIPVAATELARIGQIAGQLGVEAAPLIGELGTELGYFTEIVAKMGATTDLSTEEAAFAFARLANIMGQQDNIIEFVNGLSNAIVDLGNNAAATEPEIVAAALRIAGAGRVVGMSTQEVLGFATALGELGVRAEMGGTAVSRVMQEMFLAISEGVQTTEVVLEQVDSAERAHLESLTRRSLNAQQRQFELDAALDRGVISMEEYDKRAQKNNQTLAELDAAIAALPEGLDEVATAMVQAGGPLVTFATISGQSVEEFERAFKEDAAGAVVHFIERLAIMQDEGKITKDMLNELGLGGVRVRDVLNRMGGDMSVVTENIERANRAWEEQTALQIEYQKRINTVKSQLQLLGNQFKDLGITIFDLVKEDLARLIAGISAIIRHFREMDPRTQRLILLVGGLAAAVGPLLIAFGGIVAIVGQVATGIGVIATAMTGALGPVLLLVGAIGALIAGLVALTPLGDPVRDFIDKIRQDIEAYLSGEGLPPISIPITPVVEEPEDTGPRAPNVPVVNVVPRTLAPGPTNVRNLPEGIDFGAGYDWSEPPDLSAMRAAVTEAAIPEPEAVQAGWQVTLDTIKEKVSGFLSEISGFFTDQTARVGLLEQLGFTPEQVAELDNFVLMIESIFKVIPETVKEVFADVSEVWENDFIQNLRDVGVLEDIEVNWTDVWDAIRQAVVGAVQGIAFIVALLLSIVTGIISGLAGMAAVIIGQFQVLAVTVPNIIRGLINAVSNFFLMLRKFFTGDFDAAKEHFIRAWQGLRDAVTNLFASIAALFFGAFGGILAFLGGFIQGVINFFKNLYETLVGHSIIPDMLNAIKRVFTDRLNDVKEFVQGIIDDLKSIWTGLKNSLERIIDGIGDFIDSIGTTTEEMLDVAGGALEGVKGAFISLKEWLLGNVEDILRPIRRIGEAVGLIHSENTNSPELKLQHSFELFEDYLKTAKFDYTVGARLAPETVDSLSAMVSPGRNVSYVSNDNRIQVGDVNTYGARANPGASLMDTLRRVQSQRV